jgi:hypothetical protein
MQNTVIADQHLAEALGHGLILSTDRRDFNAYRWKNTKPFINLLSL